MYKIDIFLTFLVLVFVEKPINNFSEPVNRMKDLRASHIN